MTWCDAMDMDAAICGCVTHRPATGVVVSDSALAAVNEPLAAAFRPQPRDPRWQVTDPAVELCTHSDNGTLCPACESNLTDLLADVPDLLEQLSIAFRKAVVFPPRGVTSEDVGDPDAAPIPWHDAASNCWRGIRKLIADPAMRDPANRVTLHAQLSGLAATAHHIIDRPRDRIYCGPCPHCGHALHGERGKVVVCRWANEEGQRCKYQNAWDEHQTAQLEIQRNHWLPMRELIACLKTAGWNIDRKRVEYLETRHGLPREQHEATYWAGRELRTGPVWHYRVDDVIALQEQLTAGTPLAG